MTRILRSRVEAAEIYFVRKVAGLFFEKFAGLLDKVQSTDICQPFNIKRLLLYIERLQLQPGGPEFFSFLLRNFS